MKIRLILFAFISIAVTASIPASTMAVQLTVESSRKKAEAEKKAKEEAERLAAEAKKQKELAAANAKKASESETPSSAADDKTSKALTGISFAHPVRNKFKIGVRARAGSSRVNNAVFTFTVPKNWPEQSVADFEEELPNNAVIDTRRKNDIGIQQWVVRIPTMAPREEILITKTFLVETSQINPPPETSGFVRPKSRINEARKYLRPSPGINFSHSKIRKAIKEITKDKETPWDEVEAIYDWVRDNILDAETPPKALANTFLEKSGCNEDKVSLFVGMCRAAKVPARMVWVDGTIYAEFMLCDGENNIHWFPCNIGGIREFGFYSEPRIVIQKGDNIRVPEKDKNLKYVSEVFQGDIKKGGSPPKYKFFKQILPVN